MRSAELIFGVLFFVACREQKNQISGLRARLAKLRQKQSDAPKPEAKPKLTVKSEQPHAAATTIASSSQSHIAQHSSEKPSTSSNIKIERNNENPQVSSTDASIEASEGEKNSKSEEDVVKKEEKVKIEQNVEVGEGEDEYNEDDDDDDDMVDDDEDDDFGDGGDEDDFFNEFVDVSWRSKGV